MVRVVEFLPSKHELISSNPIITKKKKKKEKKKLSWQFEFPMDKALAGPPPTLSFTFPKIISLLLDASQKTRLQRLMEN
jgi:hypothetical protein